MSPVLISRGVRQTDERSSLTKYIVIIFHQVKCFVYRAYKNEDTLNITMWLLA